MANLLSYSRIEITRELHKSRIIGKIYKIIPITINMKRKNFTKMMKQLNLIKRIFPNIGVMLSRNI